MTRTACRSCYSSFYHAARYLATALSAQIHSQLSTLWIDATAQMQQGLCCTEEANIGHPETFKAHEMRNIKISTETTC